MNGITDSGDIPKDFVALVLDQAASRAAAIAVAGPDGTLSFKELERLSARIAQRLWNAGARPGDVIGVCMGQEYRLPAALLAVARIRAAYLPLDLRNPVDRLEYQLADSGAALILASGQGLDRAAELRHRLGAAISVIDVAGQPGQPAAGIPALPPEPGDLAYVIYTSGSSGQPKGVEVTRGNLAAHLAGVQRVFPIGAGDRMTTIAGVSFDITHLGIWGPLTSGGRCVLLAEAAHADGLLLAEQLAQNAVSILQATPTSLRTLLAARWPGAAGIRVMSGGEAIDADLARAIAPRVGELWNFYGPTEATIWATAQRLTGADRDPVPIGAPLPGYRAYVMTAAGQPAAAGETGELWLAGPGVARGYRGRPDLTARAFLDDPVTAGERAYRTGDRARWRADGTLEFLGRGDNQVKIRGYRVELGEIENRMREFPAVSDAVVSVAGQGSDTHLVAHVVWQGEPDTARLTAFMGEILPPYMLPHRWMHHGALPTLPSGKADRVALARLTTAAGAASSQAPQSPAERFLAQAWAEILEVPGVGRTDNFFELGGHSFGATLVAGRIRAVLGCRVPVRILFDNPVLADFAAEVARIAGQQPAASTAAAQGGAA